MPGQCPASTRPRDCAHGDRVRYEREKVMGKENMARQMLDESLVPNKHAFVHGRFFKRPPARTQFESFFMAFHEPKDVVVMSPRPYRAVSP